MGEILGPLQKKMQRLFLFWGSGQISDRMSVKKENFFTPKIQILAGFLAFDLKEVIKTDQGLRFIFRFMYFPPRQDRGGNFAPWWGGDFPISTL